MFNQTKGYHGVNPSTDQETLANMIEDHFPKPSVFQVIPFSQEFSEESYADSFSDVLAKRFRNLEDAMSERRIISEFSHSEKHPEKHSSEGQDTVLITCDDMKAAWKDVKCAVEMMFSDERFVKPVKSLWEVNNYHGIHCVDVALASLSLAAGSDVYAGKKDELISVGIAGLLHDVGKEMYPEIYTKLGAFTEDDHKLMKQHTKDSITIIKDALKALPKQTRYEVMKGIEDHHENWDGTGYPSGYKGNQISRAGQVIRIADSLESGTSPIRAAMYNGTAKDRQAIMSDISEKSGTWYSPYFVRVLQRGFDQYMTEQRCIEKTETAESNAGSAGPSYHA